MGGEKLPVTSTVSGTPPPPHCLGAVDGKHVAMKCPFRGGSRHYNYNGFFTVVLFPLVDANYTFIWAGIGARGLLRTR